MQPQPNQNLQVLGRGYLFGGPHNKDYSIWESIVRSPYTRKLTHEPGEVRIAYERQLESERPAPERLFDDWLARDMCNEDENLGEKIYLNYFEVWYRTPK